MDNLIFMHSLSIFLVSLFETMFKMNYSGLEGIDKIDKLISTYSLVHRNLNN